MRHSILILVFSLVLFAPCDVTAQRSQVADSHVVSIGLANGSKAEVVMATKLRGLLLKHDVEPWILTRKVLIDKDQIPHSHPVLTIHTRHVDNEVTLLSTFVHEQLHWLEEDPWIDDFQSAMKEFEKLYPEVPSSEDGGARDRESTYRHLLVCDMELQALTTLIGEAAARETLAQITHYEWVYDQVLNDPRVRKVSERNGFNVERGVPSRHN